MSVVHCHVQKPLSLCVAGVKSLSLSLVNWLVMKAQDSKSQVNNHQNSPLTFSVAAL